MNIFRRKSAEVEEPSRDRSAGRFRGVDMVMDMNDVNAGQQKQRPPTGAKVKAKGSLKQAAEVDGDANGDCHDGAGDLVHKVGGFNLDVDEGEMEDYWRLVQHKLKVRTTVGDNIVVVTRTRPFNKREKELSTTNCVRVLAADHTNPQQQVWVVNPAAPEAGPVKFSFDFCLDSFDPRSSNFIDQKTVFDLVGVDLLAKVWTGFNASIFAYGQTGSGKTYSIMGYGKEKGLIPRICETLFHFIDRHGRARGLMVEATYLEIYQEKIIDLLNPVAGTVGPLKPKDRLKLEAKRKKLMADRTNERAMAEAREVLHQLSPTYQGEKGPRVREDPIRGVVVDNLKRFAVNT